MHTRFSECTRSLSLKAHADSRLQVPLPANGYQVCTSGPDLLPSSSLAYMPALHLHRRVLSASLSPDLPPCALLLLFALESLFPHPASIISTSRWLLSMATPTASLLVWFKPLSPPFSVLPKPGCFHLPFYGLLNGAARIILYMCRSNHFPPLLKPSNSFLSLPEEEPNILQWPPRPTRFSPFPSGLIRCNARPTLASGHLHLLALALPQVFALEASWQGHCP